MRTVIGVAAGAAAIVAGVVISQTLPGAAASATACEPLSPDTFPGQIATDARFVGASVPAGDADTHVLMGAYWENDHWSDRQAFRVNPDGTALPLAARDLASLPEAIGTAYSKAFECVQDQLTAATPD